MSRIAATIGRNISFVVVSRVIAIGISFCIFPFIVKYVGKEVYGVYLIVSTVTGYFGILDFGVMSALMKYVSEFNGRKDSEMVGKIVNASFSFYVLVGIIMAALLFLCRGYFTNFFRIGPANIPIVRQLFLVAGISALFIWPLNTFRGTVQGLNLWHIDSFVNVGVQLSSALAAFFLLRSGYGIVQLFVVSQFLTVLGGAILYTTVKRKALLKIIFPYNDAGTFKMIFNFSIFMFLSSILNIFLFQAHNIIIGYFVSMSAVTIYAVAYNIQNAFRVINSTLGAPPWIVASEMEGRKDYAAQKTLLVKGTKYMSAVFIPIVLIVLVFAGPFINYWMGPGFRDSILPARIIIIFWLFNGTSELAAGMLSAKGIVRRPLMIQLAIALLSIVISLSLIKRLGIAAVALGLTVSMVCVGFPSYILLSLRTLKISFKEYFSRSIKSNLVLYLSGTILAWISLRLFYPKNLLFTIFEMAVIYGIVLSVYYFKFLSASEKADIKTLAGYERFIRRTG